MPDNPDETTQPAGDCPQWARDAITKANNEAAKYRTELRAKTDEHTQALAQIEALTAEKNTLTSQVSDAEKALLKYTVAVGSGVPGDKAADFAALLQGNDQTELRAHADSLLGLFGAPGANQQSATDPSQGQGGDSTAGLSEGGALLAKALRGIT